MIPVKVTVQYQHNGVKHSAQLQLVLAMTVQDAIEAIIGALQLPPALIYQLHYQHQALDYAAKLFNAGVQEGSIFQLTTEDVNATNIASETLQSSATNLLQRLGGRGGAEVELLTVKAGLVTSDGTTLPLQRTRALVGRADTGIGYPPDAFDAELSTLDPTRSVSRPHALIVYADGGFTIRDLYSRHGVYVNDRRVAPSGAHQIYDGDKIRIGEVELRFQLL